ncbi:hypothetical protein Bpfe_001298, partial [Biomphalaria pfeifferi]
MDRIIMYGKVDLNGYIHSPSVVYFEIKRQNETTFQIIGFLQIPKDCDKHVDNYCSCFKTDDLKVVKLVLNITAITVNSEAEIRAELVYREMLLKQTACCELELINLETETLLKSEKEIVVYNGNFNGTTHFKLKYKICNIQRNIS